VIAELRERRAVLQQEVGAAEGPGGEHESVARDGPYGQLFDPLLALHRPGVVDVADRIPALRTRSEGLHLAAREDRGALAQRRVGEIVEVERVLRAVVAADVALAAEAAGRPHAPMDVLGLVEDRLCESRCPLVR
jgi:hypothetical protein